MRGRIQGPVLGLIVAAAFMGMPASVQAACPEADSDRKCMGRVLSNVRGNRVRTLRIIKTVDGISKRLDQIEARLSALEAEMKKSSADVAATKAAAASAQNKIATIAKSTEDMGKIAPVLSTMRKVQTDDGKGLRERLQTVLERTERLCRHLNACTAK